MRIKHSKILIGILLAAIVGSLLSCATDKAPLQIENSLPQSELDYYNDSFDVMREDLWNRAGYLSNEEQMQNFQLADMRFENGKLIIRTRTGRFSKGGLGAKFAFRGDFDVQLDCRIEFLKGTSGMDQLLNILVIDKSGKIGQSDFVVINLAMGEGSYMGRLNSRGFTNGRWTHIYSDGMENFNGTLRILRKGKNISTLYKKKGSGTWSKIHTFGATEKDMIFGFQLRNFFANRTSIGAMHSISAEFDNFRINAAHEIIEEDI
jgi:hypothetical protein